MAQHGVERKPIRDHDYVRTLRFATFGGVVAGPLMVTWYVVPSTRFRPQNMLSMLCTLCGPNILVSVKVRADETRYRVLERYVTIQNPNLKVLTRVGLDQFVFAPPNLAVFFTAQSLMEGESLDEIKAKLKRA